MLLPSQGQIACYVEEFGYRDIWHLQTIHVLELGITDVPERKMKGDVEC